MKFIFMSLIKFYRKFISPLTPPKCKYYPTCSCYALKAFERFGTLRGLALSVWRLLRCNPWSMGGIDYVPEKFTFKVKKYDRFGDYPHQSEYVPDNDDVS
ncbi:MAG: membrane protein insertion efficiency factor YidD [Ruminococcus sp.]|nr:membrane protein insertion efficiency factor YidD [Ruminococcus sp.]MBR6384630.1 membrane protein insertion efficiency factor YidD [Ruminococcus sp.]